MVEVLKAGLYDTIQDLGRFGYQDFGVPISGVMDQYSAFLANAILGNSNNAALLECTVFGPYLKFNQETAICISGADMNVKLDGLQLKTNTVYRVKTGAILKFGNCNYGCRAYLAVLGGFQTEKQMGSRSMYNQITTSFRMVKGDVLPIQSATNNDVDSVVSIKIDKNHFTSNELEVFVGPEFEKLTYHQQHELFNREFLISKDSNRMAYQFDTVFENALKDIITSMVLPGTVQLTPSGRLIVLMRDCQITGGYPRILQLTNNAINKMSQQFISSVITFKRLN